ncbi:MAG: cation-translocating P-type ATPase, partial [Candidatus Peregrinibacteria bacterium]|nr:cation-translocating P-type ATPase [Candidatus Peregrinibacteria bacterium]
SGNTFSSERKMMSVICRNGKDQFLFAKGAPEMILKKCSTILINGRERPLTEKDKKEILAKSDSFAAEALRILGFAYQKNTREEKGLVFLGLQGMIDPPRKEVAKALKECREAGIRVVMITGDHPGTAIAIARELGLPSEKILTGMELDQLNEKELKATLKEVSVFARVNPEHKVKILKLLQEDHLVAMTGDGVNDAPALKQADIGISMGIRGTEVAKEASDMILLDDNFATIRSAIREGRGIFDNIRKFVNYLLSANAGEVSLIFFAIIYGRIFQASSGLLIPLMAVHLLWINLLTDGFPALALAVDPISKNVMKRPPKPRSEGVINRPVAFSVIIIGFVLGLIGLAVFLKNLDNLMKAQTMAFTTLVILELAKIEHIRARYKLSLLSNRWLIGAIALSLSLQLLVLYSPLGSHFGVLPLSLADWGQIGIALVAFLLASKIISFWQDYLFPGNHN